MPRNLPKGIYEQLVTTDMAAAITTLHPLQAAITPFTDAELPSIFAKHFGSELERALRALPPSEQLSAIETLLAQLTALVPMRRLKTARSRLRPGDSMRSIKTRSLAALRRRSRPAPCSPGTDLSPRLHTS